MNPLGNKQFEMLILYFFHDLLTPNLESQSMAQKMRIFD